ncbi:beta strand repeat-containing protein [Chloroflexota bacterium]
MGAKITIGANTYIVSGVTNNTLLTISTNALATVTGQAYTISSQVRGTLSMEGTAAISAAPTYGAAATLQYNTATGGTAGSEWITPFAATGGVIIANTGTITMNGAKVFNASVPLTISSGATLAMSTYLLTLNGNLINNGGTASGSGGVTIAGTATQSIGAFTTTGTVSVTKTADTATFTGNVNGGALTINGSGGTLNLGTGLTHTFTGTWTRTAGTLNGGSSTLKIGGAVSGSGSTFTASTGTVEWNGSAQAIAVVTYYNLTINQSSGDATLGGSVSVNGILTLTSGNLAVTDPYVLIMGATATTVGATDVTGIVKRTTLVANTSYTFGNQYTSLNFPDMGTLPTDVSLKITIGSAPSWKTDAVQRTYAFIQNGAVGSYATVNVHYLDSELNVNSENELVFWRCQTPFTPGTEIEFGRSNYDTTSNWIGVSNIDFSQIPSSFGQMEGVLGDSLLENATWNGSIDTTWGVSTNWTPNGIPSDLSDIVIPDATTTGNDPIVPLITGIGRLTIESGGILSSIDSSTITISKDSGAWINNGGTFNAGTSTVVFTNAAATISGVTDFYNVTIDSGAKLTMGSDSTMRIGGAMTNNGVWSVWEGTHNTIEYNGGIQTVLKPNGPTPGYHTLILSGSGAKTMPGTSLSLEDEFIISGTASAAAGAGMNIGGSFTVGPGTTFTAGVFTHNIGVDLSNSGTFTATGSTITLNGTVAQAIGGTTTMAFNNLTISNTSAAVSANTNFSVGGTLTVNSGAVLNPVAAVVISGGGTLIGYGTVNVTRTAATADFSSQYTTSTNTLTNLTVAYVGSAAQTVSELTYGGLTINNANDVTLGGNATVNGTLTLTSGKVTTDANKVIIGSSGSVSGGSSSSYVYSNLQKYVETGPQSPVFEVGTASNYNPVTVDIENVSGAGNLIAKVTSGEHPNIGSSTINSSKDVNVYWSFTNSGVIFDNFNATFNFNPGDIDGSATPANFIVGKYSGGWTYPTVGTPTETSTEATGVTSFSDFVVGEEADVTAPMVSTYNPSVGATGVALGANQVLTFDENVQAGTGNILIKKYSGDSIIATIAVGDAQVTFGTTAVTINPTSDLPENSTQYYVEIASGVITDMASPTPNAYAGTASKDTWKFTTVDITAPTVSTYNPSVGATGVALGANLVLTFDENVQAGTGNILIKKYSGDSIIATIAVGDAQVTFGTTAVTINPTSDLPENSTQYYVEIASGVITDMASPTPNAYAGTASKDTWKFTTVLGDVTAPTVTAITPSSGVNTGAVNITNLAGTNFVDGQTSVKLAKSGHFDINGTSVMVVSSTQITATFDLTGVVIGAWHVVVTVTGVETTGILTEGFTVYRPNPTVTAITPSSGVNTGAVNITNLAGTNFVDGQSSVKLTKSGQPDINGTSVMVVSSTQITATFDLTGAATGAWSVVVTVTGAESTGILSDGFIVISVEGPTASRNLPDTSVAVSEEFEVGIQASGFGLFGQVIETLPSGFEYVLGSVSAVSGLVFISELIDGQDVTFIFVVSTGESDISFTYNVAVLATTDGPYFFSGLLDGEVADVDPIGGDSAIYVSWSPWIYDNNPADDTIDIIEVLTAIADYFGGQITILQVLQVISLYFSP